MPLLVSEFIAVEESVCPLAVLDSITVVINIDKLSGFACVIVSQTEGADRAKDSSSKDDADSLLHGSISLFLSLLSDCIIARVNEFVKSFL